jgi:hypothetical protein
MLGFWLGALILISSLVSTGSIVAAMLAETTKQERIFTVLSVVGLVMSYIASFAAIVLLKGE